ncbi:hypothetical protein OIU79_010188 [Salix purpurea]|uniref:Uncharacterized protein n=1 Tax=Salix purpurea TaxID=77065 RepID=A0A9Q0T9G8_SALPP|nr:hypothetical protein OIU79_010188 [Salix purpurea]
MERQRSSARPNAKAENRLKVESSRPGLSAQALRTGMISTPAPASNARTSRRSGERKKGLLQRIKDGISGHSDGGGSSSSSRATVMMRNAVKERIDGQLSDVDGFPIVRKK